MVQDGRKVTSEDFWEEIFVSLFFPFLPSIMLRERAQIYIN